ncbi:TPA: hypothetical protein ACMDO7_003548 [Vibrio cholerae]
MMTKLKLGLFFVPSLLAGAYVGLRFPSLDTQEQKEMVGFIVGFSQSDLFNIAAPLSVLIFAIYVFIFGQIPRKLSGKRKVILFWLPGLSLTCSMPFFTALLSFLVVYSGDLETTKLIVYSLLGFIYSVVFLLGMLAPAFEGMYPKEISQKRRVYVLLVISLFLVMVLGYFT